MNKEERKEKKFIGMKFEKNIYGDNIDRYYGGYRMNFILANGCSKRSSVGWGAYWFALDVESDGLYGPAIAIAVTMFGGGEMGPTFEGRVSDQLVTNDWVKDNVLPSLVGMPVTHQNSEALEEAFWEFWMTQKTDAKKCRSDLIVICHMPNPVETGLFNRCVLRNLEQRQFEGPYPGILDVGWELQRHGYKPDSIDEYIGKFGYLFGDSGVPHDPRYDAKAAYSAYLHMRVMNDEYY